MKFVWQKRKEPLKQRKIVWLLNNHNIIFVFGGRFRTRGNIIVTRYGVSFKHQRKDLRWRHYAFTFEWGKNNGRLFKTEFQTHISKQQTGLRILKTKRFIRFKLVI